MGNWRKLYTKTIYNKSHIMSMPVHINSMVAKMPLEFLPALRANLLSTSKSNRCLHYGFSTKKEKKNCHFVQRTSSVYILSITIRILSASLFRHLLTNNNNNKKKITKRTQLPHINIFTSIKCINHSPNQQQQQQTMKRRYTQ